MKKHLLIQGLLPLIFIFGLTLSGKAQLLFEENFAYPSGDLITAHGWLTHSGGTTNPITTTSTSITYPGYLSSGIGNEVSLVTSGQDDNKTFATQTTGNVYASCLVNISTATATGDYFFHLGQAIIGTAFKGRVFVKNDGGTNLAFGITHTGGTSNPPIYSSFNYALNTTYLIVLKYTFVAGTANDVVSLIINPVIGSVEPSATVVAADVAQIDATDIGSVALRQGGATLSPTLKLDGIRVGSTWNDVAGGAIPTSITIASPVTGDQWRQGTIHNIIWSASGTNANVKIEYTNNASAGTPTWSILNASIAATAGTWAWNIPLAQALSTDSKIRVTDIPLTATGISGIFSIVLPPVQISTLAELRAVAPNTICKYTGQGILTFQQTFRHQKYIQDATAAILIDDNSGKVTTTYNIGDAITNITGTVAVFNGMTQFVPESDPGTPASTGNVIIPEIVTLAQLNANWENYESKLIKVPNITFTSPTGNFANGVIYPVTDVNGVGANFRTTFYSVDYIGTPVPLVKEDLVVIPNSRIDGDHITSRSLADLIYNTSDNIVITEIMYNSPDINNDSLEFIELYNKGAVTVDLTGWYFSKGIDYTFPATTIAPSSYLLIARNSAAIFFTFGLPSTQWTSGFLENNGAEVELKDAIGNVKDYVHYLPTAPWPTQANGEGPSLRLCDPTLDNSLPQSWSASVEFAGVIATGDSIYASPLAGCGSGANLAFTEIMYNSPETGVDSLEFLEIYNNGSAINLNGFHFTSGIEYTFPSVDLAAGHFLLLAGNATAFHNTFGLTALQWTSGALSNSGETITLNDVYGNVVDLVTYGIAAPWPIHANGEGSSLTLCDPTSDNNIPGNWKASTEFVTINQAGDSIFATPGAGCFNPPPFANFSGTPTLIIEGASVQFTDLTTNNPISWQWSFPGGTPSNSTEKNPSIAYLAFGLYSVTLTVTNAYGNDIELKTNYIKVGGVGIQHHNENSFEVYPNPNNGKFTVSIPTGQMMDIQITDMIGSTVFTNRISAGSNDFDLSILPKGFYLIKALDIKTHNQSVKKIIIK